MRNLQLLVILVLIIFAISLIQKEGLGSKQTQKKIIMIPIPTPTLAPTLTPTSIPIPPSIPSTSASAPSPQINISSFVYPSSIILNQSGDKITSQSTGDPQAITNWYKEKIISLNMKAKSFVETNTNGNILNKLAGANSTFKVNVTISRKNNQSSVEIKVNIN